jgi:hypothetical protein
MYRTVHYLKTLGSRYPVVQCCVLEEWYLELLTAQESKYAYISFYFETEYIYVLAPHFDHDFVLRSDNKIRTWC